MASPGPVRGVRRTPIVLTMACLSTVGIAIVATLLLDGEQARLVTAASVVPTYTAVVWAIVKRGGRWEVCDRPHCRSASCRKTHPGDRRKLQSAAGIATLPVVALFVGGAYEAGAVAAMLPLLLAAAATTR